MSDLFRLDGKIAVVIGGAGGIGEVLAMGLSRYGAKIAIGSRNLEKLNEVPKTIYSETGGEVAAFQGDEADEKGVAFLAEPRITAHSANQGGASWRRDQ
jgi:gluconate 5-dehydrogenase